VGWEVLAARHAVTSIAALWFVLWSSGAFIAAQEGVDTAPGTDQASAPDGLYLASSQVISVAIALGVMGVVLASLLATLAGLAYNAVASLVGGLQLSLRRQS
jgi:hypothetical protein